MLKVRSYFLIVSMNLVHIQTFKFIFTSPTSAEDIDDEKDVDEPSQKPYKRRRRQRAPTRGNIANIIGMKSVTPRDIAYVALQVYTYRPFFIYCL